MQNRIYRTSLDACSQMSLERNFLATYKETENQEHKLIGKRYKFVIKKNPPTSTTKTNQKQLQQLDEIYIFSAST